MCDLSLGWPALAVAADRKESSRSLDPAHTARLVLPMVSDVWIQTLIVDSTAHEGDPHVSHLAPQGIRPSHYGHGHQVKVAGKDQHA